MERNPLYHLSHDDLVAMILQTQKDLAAQEKRIEELVSEL